MLLFCADAHEILPTLANASVDLILTDPPYGGLLGTSWDASNDTFNPDLIRQCHRVLKPTGSIYVWCGIGEKSRSLLDFYERLQGIFVFKDLITWQKRRGIGMRRGWLYTREEILWFVKDNRQFIWNKEAQYSTIPNQFNKGMSGAPVQPFKRLTNVWTDIPEQLVKPPGSHPAAKPIAALERIIRAHTQPGGVVLDCFMGGGSTGVAALSLGRDFIGIEQDPFYHETARRALALPENLSHS